MVQSNELRQHPRFPIDTEIKITTPDHEVYGNVRDISLSGLFASVQDDFAEGTLCQIELIMKTGVQEMRITGHTQIVRLESDDTTGAVGLGLRIIEK